MRKKAREESGPEELEELGEDGYSNEDAVFIIRGTTNFPRIASPAVTRDGFIQYTTTNNGAMPPLHFGEYSPFKDEAPNENGRYTFKDDVVDKKYPYTIGKSPVPYSICVDSSGGGSATFIWNTKLLARQSMEYTKQVVFLSANSIDPEWHNLHIASCART